MPGSQGEFGAHRADGQREAADSLLEDPVHTHGLCLLSLGKEHRWLP